MVGDTGFEPVTSPVWKKHKIWSQFGHIFKIKNSRSNCLDWNIRTHWTQNPVLPLRVGFESNSLDNLF